jgi:hypothetical protein
LSEQHVRKVRAEQEAEFRRRLSLVNIRPEEFVDPSDYDFILGVATTSKLIEDVPRVFWDQLAGGRGTPAMQQEYELLRGRSFAALDCHSNGAMICLAALQNGDIKAGRVRLFGPQITLGRLRQWQTLLRSGEIQKLEIFLSDGDPVPVMSYAVSVWPDFEELLLGTLRNSVGREVPLASVIRIPCDTKGRFKYSLSCHSMTHYQQYR